MKRDCRFLFVVTATAILCSFVGCGSTPTDKTIGQQIDLDDTVVSEAVQTEEKTEIAETFDTVTFETVASITNAEDYSDIDFEDITTEVMSITAEQLSYIKSGLTYGEIIGILGETANFGNSGLRVYSIGSGLYLTLNFDSKDDICNMSGAELASTLISLYYPQQNFPEKPNEETQFLYCRTVNDLGYFIFENSNNVDCGTLIIGDNTEIILQNGQSGTKDDIHTGQYLVIGYEGVLETYPGQYICTSVTVVEE